MSLLVDLLVERHLVSVGRECTVSIGQYVKSALMLTASGIFFFGKGALVKMKLLFLLH